MLYYRSIVSVLSALAFYAALSGGNDTTAAEEAASYHLRTALALHSEAESSPVAKPVRIVVPLPYGQ
jgi:hypothetical protein